jgi:hypothetical protein
MIDRRSPYRTAPGSEPPELAGRDEELGAARYAIDMAAGGEAPNPIVFFGLRGMGKTALLREVARHAEAAGAVVLLIEADRDLRLANVVRDELTSALATSAPFSTRLRKALERIVENLPKLAYELPHDAGSVSISGTRADDDGQHDGLETEILNLNRQLREHGRFLMIGLDEIQEASRIDLLRIVRVVHRTAGTDSPVLFVGAGLPSIPTVLHDVRTYTERWAKFRLDVLDRSATLAAIELPAKSLGVAWTPGALQRMYEITFGYPYFLQQYASAAWLRANDSPITRDDVDSVAPGVRRLLDASLYDPQFAQLTPRSGIRPGARCARSRPPSARRCRKPYESRVVGEDRFDASPAGAKRRHILRYARTRRISYASDERLCRAASPSHRRTRRAPIACELSDGSFRQDRPEAAAAGAALHGRCYAKRAAKRS